MLLSARELSALDRRYRLVDFQHRCHHRGVMVQCIRRRMVEPEIGMVEMENELVVARDSNVLPPASLRAL
jgi:hypothetical protein